MQYITHLKAKESCKNIKEDFEWDNIPQFAVITGENGSGKSSLLQGIREGRFSINHGKNPQAIIDPYKSFELQGQGYNSTYADQIQQNEQELLNKHLQSRQNNTEGVFMQMKNNARPHPNLLPIVEKLSWEDFIKKDFSTFSQNQIYFIENWRNQLDLNKYYKHFERNEMDEEKFYFSTEEEIKKWMSQLKDRNYMSRKTIFDEHMLNSIFGAYHIAETNITRAFLQNKAKEKASIEPAELKQIIEEKLGKNPIDEVNELLSKVSKYSLHMDFNNNSNPQLVCKTQDDISISTKDLSTGEQIIISLYMWQYDKNPLHSTIFLLDEPDAHLNPKMAKMLIDVLKNVIVKKFGCQVIMTTHSLSTVAYCEEKDLFYMEEGKVSKISKEECIQNLADGVMTFERALNQLKLIENSDKPILVVEGKTEQIIFQKYYEFKNQDMPFIIIDGKGADNLPQFCTCFKIMNLPQKRVFLFDYDEKGIENFEEIKTDKKTAKLYIKSKEEMSEYQKQAKTFTIEKIFPFSMIRGYYEIGKELVKISLVDFIDGLSKKQQVQYSDFFKEQTSDECLYKIVDSKDAEKRKTGFASKIIEICKEDDLQELEKLMQRIEAEFLKK